MSSALEAIVTAAAQEPAELPRLQASQVFIHYARLGAALEQIANNYKDLPNATPQGCTDKLKELIKDCNVAIATAARLMESNR